jgi:hypothetical protein
VRPRRWTRRFWVLTPKDLRRRAGALQIQPFTSVGTICGRTT